MEPRLEIVKQIIKEEIKRAGLKLLGLKLFGSGARGDFNQSSDWDFYVIVNEDIPHKKKLGITSRIRRKMLVYDLSCDIIIHSISLVNEMKNDVGYLTYYVLKEGVELI